MGNLGNIIGGFFIAAFTSLSFVFVLVIIYISIIFSLIGIAIFILWIITLIDCVQRDDENFAVGGKNAKIIWLLLLVLINNIVPVIYYFLIMHKKPRKPKKA